MRKIKILLSFFMTFYILTSVNASNTASFDDEKSKSFYKLVSSSSGTNNSDYTYGATSKKWEDIVFIPTTVVSLCTEALLNIAGAPAAFWGVANAYNMINEENIEAFRIASVAIGGVAITRYIILNIMNPNKYKAYVKSYNEKNIGSRFTQNIDDPMSYFKSLTANLVQKVTGEKRKDIVLV